MNATKTPRSFTGRAMTRKTHWTVHAGDIASKWIITIGGIGAIVAVSVVMLFLAWVAFPLFLPASSDLQGEYAQPWSQDSGNVVHMSIDEDQMIGWVLYRNGVIESFQVEDGSVLSSQTLFEGKTISAKSILPGVERVVFGFDDGDAAIGDIRFELEFLDEEAMSDELQSLAVNESAPFREGIAARIPNGQFRYKRLAVEFNDAFSVSEGQAIRLLQHSINPAGMAFASLSEDGRLTLNRVREQTNFMTGKTVFRTTSSSLPYEPRPEAGLPMAVLITGLGDNVYTLWRDGVLMRFDARDMNAIVLAETLNVLPDGAEAVTAHAFLIGQKTLLIGDSEGGLGAWFRVRREGVSTPDESVLVNAHRFTPGEAAVTSLSASQRGRVAAVGYADGRIRLVHVTSEKNMTELAAPNGQPVERLKLASKEDGLFAVAGDEAYRWSIDPRHPEATLKAIFGKVWYEGYAEPMFVWQSSSGTDDFEPKYNLIPLIFGTVKATLYSMLFAMPLAILAAIFTSEFLNPRTKSLFKPTIELMASLPSVVLGFMAALVFSNWVENFLPAVICFAVTLPLSCLVGAYLYQLLPEPLYLRLIRFRLLFLMIALPLGFYAAIAFGPAVESLFFAGDIMRWLDGQIGTGTGGWMFLLLPLSAMAAFYALSRWVNPWFRQATSRLNRAQMAMADLARFAVSAVAVFAFAWAASAMLTAIGFDPRGAFIDTYVQRNALIVGFVMGFAVIPIIYTIADDALSSVPEHLRSASLGCGATPWQTATYIVIPTAMSGLFSAVMIGLGRAVGETMIVLMAAGNTPVLDWNVFNGFRTLSANIAVELPEAVRNSTHYRMLFLAALTLFVMTFILNTVAEMVRLRFRKRTYEL